MTYYNIQQGINETCPCTTLHNMGLIWHPQTMRGIPDKNIMVFKIKEESQRKILILFIIEPNKNDKDI